MGEQHGAGRGWRWLLVVALGVLLGGGALLLSGTGEPDPADAPRRLAEQSGQVRPGTCLATLPPGATGPLDLVDCEEQHVAEVVSSFELAGSADPDDLAVLAEARARCEAELRDYVGAPVDAGELAPLPVFPDEVDDASGGRTVVCLAHGPGRVGSARDTGR